MPIEKLENGAWPHPSRLALACGWTGQCTAPGYEGETPSDDELREFCNLGYAEKCSRLPRQRPWDSVRFSARTVTAEPNSASKGIHVRYICERQHLPADHGLLEFDALRNDWTKRHADSRVQRMAECFLAVYLEKRKRDIEPVAS